MKQRDFFSILMLLILSPALFAQNAEGDIVAEASQTVEAPVLVENAAESSSRHNLDFVSFFTPTPEYTLEAAENAETNSDFKLYSVGFETIFNVDMGELYGKTGFNFSSTKTDFSLDVQYGPVFFDQLQAGPRIIIHNQWYYDNYFENDLLFGGFVSYNPLFWLKTEVAAFFQLKSTDVFSIKKSCPWFYSTCPAIEWKTYFYPLDWLTLETSLSTYTFFKYFLFCSPDFGISAAFKANENLSICVKTEFQYVDFFTLSANFDSLSFCVSAIWRF